jgi:F-type H+-transporting ATPase subunit delta
MLNSQVALWLLVVALTLGAAFADSRELRLIMASPTVSDEDKAGALNALAAKMGLARLSANFVGVVARNGRGADIPDMARAFARLAAKRRGATSADVASAEPLSAAQIKELKTALKTALGRDVDIRAEVRPELIGGLVVKVGSRMFDSSLSTKLAGMRKTMKEA